MSMGSCNSFGPMDVREDLISRATHPRLLQSSISPRDNEGSSCARLTTNEPRTKSSSETPTLPTNNTQNSFSSNPPIVCHMILHHQTREDVDIPVRGRCIENRDQGGTTGGKGASLTALLLDAQPTSPTT
ncbi:uncharacterized protein BO72DRAFT_446561 [Aspergillus fijiensis CBS 313.89]|uniref:Uncharacterized protein n=1 Tax=Aspergillus fijiensis CBS 313.89 TaxID=1448319 RepID=A0A8G1W3N0_9EURO|nr:uncharacterized protein BO72DRAFT_446561 [Aspergillus fijiensis CBS 313.89]RAK79279.1 hypothetical protein BO72DRAFT_446561 [Aspergillus fijiensis CBS 313.89]